MSTQPKYSFVRYLSSKKSIDDRALNRHVWNTLYSVLPDVSQEKPLQVLEVGAGIGTMIERLIDWGLLIYAEYTALDADAENIAEAQGRLSRWTIERGFSISWLSKHHALIDRGSCHIALSYNLMDIYDFFDSTNKKWDVLIAHAFMDLVDLPIVFSGFRRLLKPGGLVYLTLNYDGETILLPPVNTELDEQIISLYNQSMDERIIRGRRSGDSKTGRHLFQYLQEAHLVILAVGSSDWIVYPQEQSYPQDEAYFLHAIIQTIDAELKEHPALSAQEFDAWVQARHAQIERGELIYIAKQLDFLARVS